MFHIFLFVALYRFVCYRKNTFLQKSTYLDAFCNLHPWTRHIWFHPVVQRMCVERFSPKKKKKRSRPCVTYL